MDQYHYLSVFDGSLEEREGKRFLTFPLDVPCMKRKAGHQPAGPPRHLVESNQVEPDTDYYVLSVMTKDARHYVSMRRCRHCGGTYWEVDE